MLLVSTSTIRIIHQMLIDFRTKLLLNIACLSLALGTRTLTKRIIEHFLLNLLKLLLYDRIVVHYPFIIQILVFIIIRGLVFIKVFT